MEKEAKIYVAGHLGLVGSSIMRSLDRHGFKNIVHRSIQEMDLRDPKQVSEFFTQEKPDYVFFAAAKVGGIVANNTYPAEFIYDNLMIECNIIHNAYLSGVKKLLFLGSSCIYPKFCPQPMKEEHLLTGVLEPTNEPYAIAKIAGIKLCEAYNRQYKTNFISAMPTNLYGPNDNYDLNNSHVLPALIRKFHEAKVNNAPSVTVWGTGTPRRELLYSDDLADALVYLMENFDENGYVNVGYGKDYTIAEFAQFVKEAVGYEGQIVYDTEKPDGTPVKFLDSSKILSLGWKPKIELSEGIKLAYADFLTRYVNNEK